MQVASKLVRFDVLMPSTGRVCQATAAVHVWARCIGINIILLERVSADVSRFGHITVRFYWSDSIIQR